MDWKNADLYILMADDGEYGYNEPVSVFKNLEEIREEIKRIYSEMKIGNDVQEVIIEEGAYKPHFEYIREIHVKVKFSWGISDAIYAVAFVKFSEGNNIIRSWNINDDPEKGIYAR